MAFELIHKPTFTNQLLAIPRDQVVQILQKIEILRDDPAPHSPVKKKLHGYKGNVYRLRSGDYRVVYTYGDGWVSLLGVDARKDVYKGEHLVAEEPSVPIDTLPELEDWLEPVERSAHASGHARARASAIYELPVRLTSDLLARLLVPEQYVSALAACKTFDDLFAVDIPESLRDRIFDNITARNFDVVLSQPNFITGDINNLLRFTEGELTTFLLQLSFEQEKYVNWGLNATGPTLVKGGPGTGKSTVALYRTRMFLQALRKAGQSNPRILFTTYTTALVAASRQLLESLLGDDVRCVDVRTADSLMMAICSDEGDMDRRFATPEDLRQAMAYALSNVTFHGDDLQQKAQRRAIERLNSEYLIEEIGTVIEARQLKTIQQYLAAARPGRKIPLNLTQRTAIWRVRDVFLQALDDAECQTWQQLRARAAGLVNSGRGPKPYDAVIVDEAQDLDPSAVRALVGLCNAPNRLFVTADANQSIYGSGFRWSDVHEHLQFKGRTGVLHANYRSTREIGEAAQVYLAAGILDDDDTERGYIHSGPQPAVRQVRTNSEETELLCRYLPAAARSYHLGLGACAVLCPTEKAGRAIAEDLRSVGVAATFMTGRDLNLLDSGVKVITLKSAKGLEFPVVALAGFNRGFFPGRWAVAHSGDGEELLARERRTIFVGMTRAMRALLVVVPVEQTSLLLTGFDVAYWNLE